jgi:hypothetical protein
MTKLGKILLTIGVVAFVVGFTPFGGTLLWGILKPTGAILVIATFLQEFVGKNMHEYDEEHQRRISGSHSKS